MRIESIHIKNFKRFTDLLISDIPVTAKLVVVAGPNGCGKSSLFDAFLRWFEIQNAGRDILDTPYYQKNPQEPYNTLQNVRVTLHGNSEVKWAGRGNIYIRTPYRDEADISPSLPSFTETQMADFPFGRLIDDDRTVSENYYRVLFRTIDALYGEEDDNKTIRQLREETIESIRRSISRVFGDLTLARLSPPSNSMPNYSPVPNATGGFIFDKGATTNLQYRHLSGGEKGAFNLLLDVHVKKGRFSDAVYCIDEVEAHLHTRVQGALVQELVRIIPDNAQLWVTTHSLGVLRAAQRIEAENPGSTCVIDFTDADLDNPLELRPATLGRVSWEKMLSITLDDLAGLVAPRIIVVCEGSTMGNHRKSFDASVYEQILGTQEPDISFVSGGSSQQVAATGNSVREILAHILPQTTVVALADRDDKSPGEIAQYSGITLTERNIESYILADEVIEALVRREGKDDLLGEALKVKSDALASSMGRGNPKDDLKSAAGDIHVGLMKLLELQQPGNNTDAFMKYTMSPLIVPGMETYQKLKTDIVDKVKK